jgi:CheY-like chemotaxis protein
MKRKHLPVIAIADNDPDDQFLLRSAFEECRPDLRIHFFENGEDLLDFLHRRDKGGEEKSAADLIILDLYLPGKNGFELIEEIKSSPGLKRLPLIVLTCSPTDSDIKRCYELGANTVITKPSPFRELAEVLKTVCNYWFGSVRM